MCSKAKASTSSPRQVSFLDHPALVGTARLVINVSPEEICENRSDLCCVLERSFDDLGAFDFLAFRIGDGVIGFRRHTNNSRQYSYVSSQGVPLENLRDVLQTLIGRSDFEVEELEGCW